MRYLTEAFLDSKNYLSFFCKNRQAFSAVEHFHKKAHCVKRVQMRKNTEQKKLHIWTIFPQWLHQRCFTGSSTFAITSKVLQSILKLAQGQQSRDYENKKSCLEMSFHCFYILVLKNGSNFF